MKVCMVGAKSIGPRREVRGGGEDRDQLTCSHDACGGNWQHVLVAVRWVVGWPTRLPASICLCPRGGDGKKCCLVVRRRRVRKGGALLLLLFHLVQEHGVLDLWAERALKFTDGPWLLGGTECSPSKVLQTIKLIMFICSVSPVLERQGL